MLPYAADDLLRVMRYNMTAGEEQRRYDTLAAACDETNDARQNRRLSGLSSLLRRVAGLERA